MRISPMDTTNSPRWPHRSRHPASRSIAAGLAVVGLVALAGCAPRGRPTIDIIPRSAWATADPLADRLTTHRPTCLTIHHAGVADDGGVAGDEKMRRLYTFSTTQKTWGDVPYHYIITRQGEIFEGRSIRYAPDTNTGYSVDGHIGICVNGDLTTQPLLEVQYRQLVALLVHLTHELKIPDDAIAGHMDYSPGKTSCPGVLDRYLKDGTLLRDVRAARKGEGFEFREVADSE
jgi:hypothetical protein